MGKKIDRLAVAALFIALFFIACFKISGSIAVACVCSLLAIVPLRYVLQSFSEKHKKSAADARRILDSWVWESEETAKEKIHTLLNPEEATLPIVFILRPKGFSISKSDIFSQWKAHPGNHHLIIAGTCHADTNAVIFAESLRNPAIILLDAGKLVPRIRKSDICLPSERTLRDTIRLFRSGISSIVSRCSWMRISVTAFVAFFLYLLHGNPLSLILALCLLFLAGISFRVHKT